MSRVHPWQCLSGAFLQNRVPQVEIHYRRTKIAKIIKLFAGQMQRVQFLGSGFIVTFPQIAQYGSRKSAGETHRIRGAIPPVYEIAPNFQAFYLRLYGCGFAYGETAATDSANKVATPRKSGEKTGLLPAQMSESPSKATSHRFRPRYRIARGFPPQEACFVVAGNAPYSRRHADKSLLCKLASSTRSNAKMSTSWRTSA